MKKLFFLLLLSIFTLAYSVLIGNKSGAASPNLIANNSVEVESANSSIPQGWNTDRWGSNTASFTYPNSNAQDGTRSVRVDVSSYTNGDAKWAFAPVTVSANTQYTFSNYYRSSTTTHVIERVIEANGNTSYYDLGDVPASDSWTQASFNFTTPSNTDKVTIIHIINSDGYLETDNYSLYVASPTPTPNPTDNFVPNPSLEISGSSSGVPQNWTTNSWGINSPIFTYVNTAHTGSKAIKLSMSSYENGDAKWYYSPQPVIPGKSYSVADYYQASVDSRVVVWFQKNGGVNEYIELDTAASSSDWSRYESTVVAPQGAEFMTVFHLLSQNGFLITDDFEVKEVAPDANPIPNSSVESVSSNPSIPAQWLNNSWGTNNASFDYLNEGHTGNRSVKVSISSYVDGDAKWYFAPQSFVPGKQYLFTDYYKSDVQSRIVLRIERSNGDIFYKDLKNAEPSTDWAKYSDTFTMPSDGVKLTVLHLISRVGFLITDDYSIEPYLAVGFDRALLTLTFDDGWEGNVDTVLPMMGAYGYKSTQFYATQFIEGAPDTYKILEFRDAGHEIGSHSVTHPDLTTLSPEDLDYELVHSKEYLESLVGEGMIRNFALPYGAYNDEVINKISQYYESNRTVNAGYNSKDNFDIYRLRLQNILNTTTAAEVQDWIQTAQADKTWLILIYHRVDNNNPGTYDTTPELFSQHLEVISNSGTPVVTYQQGLDEVIPQL